MRALLFRSKDQPLKIGNMLIPVPKEGEVLIKLQFAALNHLDLWIWSEKQLEKAVVSGADGSGIIQAVGEGVDTALIGQEVIINPSLYWGEKEHVSGDAFEILGNPTNGTFAEYIRIPKSYVYPKPDYLNLQQAAALPLAALTAYRALFTKASLQANETVLITGIGGGAALYLLQMAVAAGAKVYVTSSSPAKINKAKALGALDGFLYNDAHWVSEAKQQAGGFDVIIDSAGGNGFAHLTEVANPGARIVVFGRTAGDINQLKPALIFNKQLQILGTMMGTPREFAGMLDFYAQHQLQPILDKNFPLSAINEARAYMQTGDHFGKITLSVQD